VEQVQHPLQVGFIVQTDQILEYIPHHPFQQYGLMGVLVQEHFKDQHQVLWWEEVMVTHLVLVQVERGLILVLVVQVEHMVMPVVVTEVLVKVMIQLHVVVAVVLAVWVGMVQQVQRVVLVVPDHFHPCRAVV
jgi:hypothetical protein